MKIKRLTALMMDRFNAFEKIIKMSKFGAFECLRISDFQTAGRLTNHFIERRKAQFSHDFAQFHGGKTHEVHDVFRFALKALAQFFVLSRNAKRTRIE